MAIEFAALEWLAWFNDRRELELTGCTPQEEA